MARASSKRSGRTPPNARARGREQRVAPATPAKQSPPSYEEGLFFMRLRRHQKWVFALLAALFFLGFVVLGIGSGNGFLIDAFQSLGGASSSIESVNDAQKKVDENPNDPAALLALATAQQAASQPEDAAATLERYVKLRPDDADALNQLASIYAIQVAQAANRAGELQLESQSGSLSSKLSLFPTLSGFIGAVGQDPIDNALTNSVSLRLDAANSEVARLQRLEVPVWQALIELTPNEPLLYYQLGAAAFGTRTDDATAITAFKKFLELAPDDPLAAGAKNALIQLGAVSETDATGDAASTTPTSESAPSTTSSATTTATSTSDSPTG
jgi:tetratricopeptide (TPR) repeat protein